MTAHVSISVDLAANGQEGEAVLHGDVLCAECLTPMSAKVPRAMFCSPEHRAAWHNRQTVRGRVLTTLAMVTRATRGGSRGDKETGREARIQADRLMQQWKDDDREAGRMSQVDYYRRRLKMGYQQ